MRLKINTFKSWTKPLFILSCFSFCIFFINKTTDRLLHNAGIDFFSKFYSGDLETISNAIGGLGEVITALLGIQITAVAIIVQLSANKYSSKLLELFIENKINFLVIGLFVSTAINTILVTNTITDDYIPYFSITVTLILIVSSLLIVIPHFNYVFNFIRPQNFLDYVKNDTFNLLTDLGNGTAICTDQTKQRVRNNISFIGDIALSFVNQGDRAITLLSVKTLQEVLCQYLQIKIRLPEKWFEPTGSEMTDPDLSNYSSYVMENILTNRVVLERKVFRIFELVYTNSRLAHQDVASGVLYNSRLAAMAAIRHNDTAALNNILQYFNSYLRMAINARDPRSAFNILDQYRIIGEELISIDPQKAETLAFYFKYYGQEANKNQVIFIPETVAHDLCTLNQLAYTRKAPNLKALLDIFLTLDEPLTDDFHNMDNAREHSLIGVRIAQVKLALFYLSKGETELARVVFDDMKAEPATRIKKIYTVIKCTRDAEFWEVTSRGINFFYVPEEQMAMLDEFFGWFGDIFS